MTHHKPPTDSQGASTPELQELKFTRKMDICFILFLMGLLVVLHLNDRITEYGLNKTFVGGFLAIAIVLLFPLQRKIDRISRKLSAESLDQTEN